MKLRDFMRQFPDEESCRSKFREYRESVGVVCPRCGCVHHYWIGGSIQMFQCRECGRRQSLRSHTVMHASHLPFSVWFLAMYLMTQTRTPMSACEVQRQIGLRWYRPVWLMMQKIRTAMDSAEDQSMMSGEVELDEAFFSVVGATGSKGNSDVLVVAESAVSRNVPQKGSRGRNGSKNDDAHTRPRVYTCTGRRSSISYSFGRLRMISMQAVSSDEIRNAAMRSVKPGTRVRSDASSAHNRMRDLFDISGRKLQSTQDVMNSMPWVHIMIGNMKDELRCIRKGKVDESHFQLYLSEFTYRKNRRGTDIFSMLGRDMASHPNTFYERRGGSLSIPDVLLS